MRLATITLLALLLTITTTSPTPAGSTEPQNMVGVWDGFIAVMGDAPQLLRTEITAQENRRFSGLVSPPEAVLPISIEGTVSASGKVNYQGQTADGRHDVGKTDLIDLGGGAAILNGSVTRFSNDGTFIVPCVLVMRPFESNPLDPARVLGRYVGSMTTDDVTAQIDLRLANPPDPVRSNNFGGTVEIAIDGQTHTFQLLATANSDGRVVAIAHGTTGHLILDAVFAQPPDSVQPASLNGTFTLEFADGSVHTGSFQTEVVRPAAT